MISLAEKARARKGGHGHHSIRRAFGASLLKAKSFADVFSEPASQLFAEFAAKGGGKRFREAGMTSEEEGAYLSSEVSN